MNSVFAFVPDGAEWEDIMIFKTLEDAKDYAIHKFCTRVRNGTLDSRVLNDFHIEEFARSGDATQMSPTYLSFRLNLPSSPLDVLDLWNDVMNDEIDTDSLFKTL